MNSSRRDFIKISMWGAGATAVAGSLYSVDVFGGNKDDFNYDRPNLKRFPTYCDVCFWKCAGWTYVDNKGTKKKILATISIRTAKDAIYRENQFGKAKWG